MIESNNSIFLCKGCANMHTIQLHNFSIKILHKFRKIRILRRSLLHSKIIPRATASNLIAFQKYCSSHVNQSPSMLNDGANQKQKNKECNHQHDTQIQMYIIILGLYQGRYRDACVKPQSCIQKGMHKYVIKYRHMLYLFVYALKCYT